METHNLIFDKIIARLEQFNYRYEQKETTLKVFLPMWCYLKLTFGQDKIRMTSHIRFGFHTIPMEYNFYIYALGLYLLTTFYWTSSPNKGVFMLFGLIIVWLVICFLKTESMRSIIHLWIDQDKRLKGAK